MKLKVNSKSYYKNLGIFGTGTIIFNETIYKEYADSNFYRIYSIRKCSKCNNEYLKCRINDYDPIDKKPLEFIVDSNCTCIKYQDDFFADITMDYYDDKQRLINLLDAKEEDLRIWKEEMLQEDIRQSK